ncbi:tyrosine-type recombinase/integrase [Uliginosibacterium flavum]|uniref:Site-specific integrase n=1 Tax=Uliginosibacterium flavum TaxID=1396831 RepID=A0ABV2TK60_9RHOO
MASIRKRGERYQARIQRNDFPALEKTFTRKCDAEAWAKITESEMIRGTFIKHTEADTTTLRVALARYEKEVTITKRGAAIEKHRIAKWKKHQLGSTALSKLKPSDFASYRDGRLREGAAPATARLELALISHLFTIARKEWGFTTLQNPIKSIRMPVVTNARNRLFLDGEEALLLAAMDTAIRCENGQFCEAARNIWLKPTVELALETAMRRGELLTLRWENIDFRSQVAHLPITKNGQSRDVPLSTRALAIFHSLPRSLSGPVFPITANSLHLSFKRAIARAQKAYLEEITESGCAENPRMLTDLHFHDLRHIAVTRLADKLPNIVELAAVSGHNDVRMLKRYYHPRAEDLAKKLG